MKIPNSIMVFGREYTVKRVKQLKDDDGRPLSGFHEYEAALISLDSELKGSDLVQTFLHELGHAVQQRCGINQAAISDDLTEVIVDSMATFIEETFHLRLK